jgi:alpha-glucosidase
MKSADFRLLILFVLIIPVVSFCTRKSEQNNQQVTISSPDGAIQILFQLKDGSPFYSVQRESKPLLNDSRMGFLLKELPALDKDFEIVSAEKTSFDETWKQPWGEVSTIRNNYNCVTI